MASLNINIDCDTCASSARQAIRDGIESWRAIPGSESPIAVITSFHIQPPYGESDGYNNIVFRDLFAINIPNANAVTVRNGTPLTQFCPCFWYEGEVWLNVYPVTGPWCYEHSLADSVPDPVFRINYDNTDLVNTIRHEIGHLIGFVPEESTQVSSMTALYSYGGAKDAWLHADDRNALRTYYPSPGSPPGGWETDVQIGGWQLDDYYDASTLVPVPAPWPVRVQAGSGAIVARYVLENLGTTSAGSRRVGIYLSSDQVITQSDVRVDSETVVMPPPATGGASVTPWLEHSSFFQIPCSIAEGDYYIGAILDYGNLLAESREEQKPANNNTMIFPIAGAATRIHVDPCAGSSGFVPGPPRNLSATDSTLCYFTRLRWDPPNSGGPVTFYEVFRDSIHISEPDSAQTTLDVRVQPGIHTYYVKAWNIHGMGSASQEDQGSTKASPLSLPTNLAASQDSCGKVKVAWSWPGGATLPETINIVDWSPFYPVVHTIGGTQTDFMVNPTRVGQTNVYSMSGHTQADLCDCRPPSFTGFAVGGLQGAPGSVTATPVGCSQILVAWSYGDPDGGKWGFAVYRDGMSPAHQVSQTMTRTDTSWVDSAVSPGTGHTYYVQAHNACGTSGFSAGAFATAGSSPPSLTSASASPTACCDGINVTWGWSTWNPDSFHIFRGGALLGSVPGIERAWFDVTASVGVPYQYSVAAWNNCGDGPLSTTATVSRCTPASTWSSNGVALSTAAQGGYNLPRAVSDGHGGAVVTWVDHRNGTADIYAQKISRDGNPCWSLNGVPVCVAPGDQSDPDIAVSGNGMTLIVWTDQRGAEADIYCQALNSGGGVVGAANGVPVCTAVGVQGHPRATAIRPDKSYIDVVWNDFRDPARQGDVYAMRMAPSALTIPVRNGRMWGANLAELDGLPVSTTLESQHSPAIVSDNESGTYVVWDDGRYGVNSRSLVAQRLDRNGVRQWSSSGVEVARDVWIGLSSIPYVAVRSLSADPGIVVAWTDNRANSSRSDIFAQRVDSNGLTHWGVSGQDVSGGKGNAGVFNGPSFGQGLDLVESSDHSVIVAWMEARTGNTDIYCRRVSTSGGYPWGDSARAICTAAGDQDDPHIVPDGSGGGIVAWGDRRNATQTELYGRIITSSGSLLGSVDGDLITPALGAQAFISLVERDPGSAIVAYEDYRTGDPDIYASRLEPVGVVGVDPTMSYFVPQAGSVAAPNEGQVAYKNFRMCPNNDGGASLPLNARLKIVLKDPNGNPLPGVAPADIALQFNGGTAAQGFVGEGADSIIANRMFSTDSLCPEVRYVAADSATDLNGMTYLTLAGSTPGQRGVASRDTQRKWGHYDTEIPVLALGVRLQGRLTTSSPNGTYVLQIKNFDWTGGTGALLGQGQNVSITDFNGVSNGIGINNVVSFWKDFNWNGVVDTGDLNIISGHQNHKCNSPSDP